MAIQSRWIEATLRDYNAEMTKLMTIYTKSVNGGGRTGADSLIMDAHAATRAETGSSAPILAGHSLGGTCAAALKAVRDLTLEILEYKRDRSPMLQYVAPLVAPLAQATLAGNPELGWDIHLAGGRPTN